MYTNNVNYRRAICAFKQAWVCFVRYREIKEERCMKTRGWQRLLSLVLAAALLIPAVLNVLPGIGQTVSAEVVDAGTLGANYALERLNGVYEIRIPNSEYYMSMWSVNYNAPLHVDKIGTTADARALQRWVIMYGGSVDKNGETVHWYTIRNLKSGRLLCQTWNYFVKTNDAAANNGYYKWCIFYNKDTGTYSICNLQQYLDGYYGYMTPAQKDNSEETAEDTYENLYAATENGALVAGMKDPYWYELDRVMIQNYDTDSADTYALDAGTYRVKRGDVYLKATGETSALDIYNEYGTSDGLTLGDTTALNDGSELFIFDWTSGGYVSFFDAKNGWYIGDRVGATTAYNKALSELEDVTTNWFDDRLRYFWIPIPVYDETSAVDNSSAVSRLEYQYYLCNVLTGKYLYYSGGTGSTYTVRNDLTTRDAWTFTEQSVSDVYGTNGAGAAQGFNGNTGVYLDSLDHSDTIQLPIKIYDYENDGLLFEYAQYTGEPAETTYIDVDGSIWTNYEEYASVLSDAKNNGYTDGSVKFSLGNNRGFTFQSGSTGGTWDGNTNGYHVGGNSADAWNTYKTFLIGRNWSIQGSAGKWYTTTYNATSNSFSGSYIDYNWETYGLGDFRILTGDLSGTTGAAYNRAASSIYYIAGRDDVSQGINKETKTERTGNFQSFTAASQSGTTSVNTSSSSYSFNYSGYSYNLHGYITGQATLGLVQPELKTVTAADGTTYRVPEYRDVVVDYMAYMLYQTLDINKTNKTSAQSATEFAYNFVSGTTHSRYGNDSSGNPRDLATWLRARLGFNSKDWGTGDIKLGSYSATMAKVNSGKLIGTWADCQSDIQTVYDAAYYLLANLFVENSYNDSKSTFDYLELTSVKVDDADGNIVDAYVFDSGFTTGGTTATGSDTAVEYDAENGVIRNSAVTGKATAYLSSTSTACAHPFLPVFETDGNGNLIYVDHDGDPSTAEVPKQKTTESPYLNDDGVTGSATDVATYENRNYNFVIASNGEFVYYEDDNLFFNFEGDDDVYLFINGQLVLDIGGAHASTGFEINLNDYVSEARANVERLENDGDPNTNPTARDYALALEEGQIATFDFYYMERHGWGSNMRIVTNLRITEPGMQTNKSAYQNGEEIAYGGLVDGDQPVEYQFEIKNTGNTSLYNLSFTDHYIGLAMNATEGLVVTDLYTAEDAPGLQTNICDANGVILTDAALSAYVTGLKAYITDGEGNTSGPFTFADNEALISFLTVLEGTGLAPGSTVSIRGFYYKLTDKQKNEGVFNNTLLTSATTARNPEDEGYDTLTGIDRHRVYVPSNPMYYHWQGNTLTVTADDLLSDIKLAVSDSNNPLYYLVKPTIKSIQTVTLADRKDAAPEEVRVENNTLYVTYASTGTKLLYLTVNYTYTETVSGTTQDATASATIPVLIYVLDVEDYVYVLDYGLKAELSYAELFSEDVLSVTGKDTSYEILGLASKADTPTYNTSGSSINSISFTLVDSSTEDDLWTIEDPEHYDGIVTVDPDATGEGEAYLTYQPDHFMDDLDPVYIGVRVHESSFTDKTVGVTQIRKEVEMFKKVTFLPATVVYYEDDFAAISYETTQMIQSSDKTAGTFVHHGSGSGALTQGTAAETPYGQDLTYQDAANGEMSGSSLTTVNISEYKKTASFTFKGTGFEIISRTNAYDSASLVVTVKDEGGSIVRMIPVITEFTNINTEGDTDEVWQVPVIRVDGLTLGTYTAEISGMPTYFFDENYNVTGTKTTYLYIDGIRIYQPLGSTNENYYAAENGATFVELRTLILEGQAAVAVYEPNKEKEGTTIYSGNVSWTENRNGTLGDNVTEYQGNQLTGIDDYMLIGPNNEAYLNGADTDQAVIFYVREDADAAVHSLQIAARAIDADLFTGSTGDGMAATLYQGVMQDGQFGWRLIDTIESGTEQYYVIDYSSCPSTTDEDTGITTYQVALHVGSGMISFTNVKYNGFEICQNDLGSKTTLTYYGGTLYTPESGEEEGEQDGQVPTSGGWNYYTISQQMRSLAADEPQEPDAELPETQDPVDPVPDDQTPDAGVSDPETPDTEIPDSETPDADLPDTDVPEAGAADTQSPDAGDTESGGASDQIETNPKTGDTTILGFILLALVCIAILSRKKLFRFE